MKQSPSVTYNGVDVCKDFLDAFSPNWAKPKRYGNSIAGISKLLEALKDTSLPQLGIESTGGYERPLRIAAADSQVTLSMVNPRQVRDFAKASGKLAKTDALDAKILAAFGEALDPKPSLLPSKKLQKLRSFVRRRSSLNDLRIAEQNQLDKTQEPIIAKEIRSLIKILENRIAKLEKLMIQLMDSDIALADKRQRLEEIKGVGPVVSATLLAELPELGSLANPQIASLCGLAPFNRDSGTHKGKRMIIGGRGRIRKTLYMPTLCAIQHNPPLKDLYQRLVDNGKPAKVAITAAMRRLLCLLNRMISDRNFQPQ